jgi:hypothetical protein
MNRNELLKLLPENSIGAEIGVWVGEYSKIILEVVKPKKLFLVDVWGHISLSYNDHLMADNIEQEKRFQQVAKQFLDKDNVYLIRTTSNNMPEIFPENFFDWIYIDGDHSYEGCKLDLNISKKIVKENGYILGHDYNYKFQGVVDSVNEFVKENNYCLSVITRDKNPTYLISRSLKDDQLIKEKIQKFA